MFGSDSAERWAGYLLFALFPLSVYAGTRLLGWSRWTAGGAALVTPLLVSVTGYGYESFSYTWLGNGLWSQEWGMFLLPLAWGFSWRAISGTGRGRYALAALVVGLTIAMHFLTGYFALLSIGVLAIVIWRGLLPRIGRAALVFGGAALVASWVVVPLITDGAYFNLSQFNQNTFWLELVGSTAGARVARYRAAVRSRQIPHRQHPRRVRFRRLRVPLPQRPTRTSAAGSHGTELRALLRPPDVRLRPESPARKQRSLPVPLHDGNPARRASCSPESDLRGRANSCSRGVEPGSPGSALFPLTAGLMAAVVLLTLPAWFDRASYAANDSTQVSLQIDSDQTDGVALDVLINEINARGGGRTYAGLPSNWGQQYAIGGVPVYEYLADNDVAEFGFPLRTPSLLTDNEAYFNQNDPAQYQLYNIRYILMPSGMKPPVPATLLATSGRHRLWTVATTGYLEVVDTAGIVEANRADMASQMQPFLLSTAFQQGAARDGGV